jgi:hypothetical protein
MLYPALRFYSGKRIPSRTKHTIFGKLVSIVTILLCLGRKQTDLTFIY